MARVQILIALQILLVILKLIELKLKKDFDKLCEKGFEE